MSEPINDNNYSLIGNTVGWLLAFFLTKKALADRDARLDKIDAWQTEHSKDHIRSPEIFRMHEENRQLMEQIMLSIAASNENHHDDFRHLNDRIDTILKERK